ncbi:MAG: bifunctional glycosyltransferase family 2/GtrA family protein [Clostridia bacterium]|nr:bifunctional glycosyltransferase family 2/GtrA family protein [Clostridia bacterium]
MTPNVTVIIPSLNPDEKLRKTVESLLDIGFTDIILINDGSGEEFVPNFPKDLPNCTLLTHEVNRGKGAAMKTAFRHFLETGRTTEGVITVDGDGQHLAEDVLRCAEEMCNTESVVLGVRDFSGPDVPPRSKFGNRTTSFVFKLFCGLKVSDTQTGLRAIPAKYLPEMLAVDGDRYEYETNALLQMGRLRIPSTEMKIRTVYIEENQTSHFRPFRDSFRIYSLIFKFVIKRLSQFLKFLASSALSFVLDLGLFALVSWLLTPLIGDLTAEVLAAICARVVSSLVNFTVNKKRVFKSSAPNKGTLIRYYILAVAILAVSTGGISLFSLLTKMAFSVESTAIKTLVKGCIDTALFIFSFNIQKKWVFADNNDQHN